MIEVEHVTHVFGEDVDDQVTALADVSLTFEATEFVAIVGASGCGKSTLLRLIAGLIRPTAGSVMLSGELVTRATPEVGLVFQKPTLLPWANVLDNVLFPLRMLNELTPAGVDRAHELLDRSGLGGFEKRLPDELSGGMQQRVALCRGLIRDPAVLLMDEPFAALDALTREEMGAHLLELWSTRPKTVLFVTHSVPEAVMLADRVVVMSPRPGRVADIIPVNLPRPRHQDMEAMDEYQACSRAIRDHIFAGRRQRTREPARQKVA